MNVVLLNTNSFGGNYEYSRCLAKAYAEDGRVNRCTVVIPANATQAEDTVYRKILISDISWFKQKLLKQIYFLYRSLVNPFRVYSFLKKEPQSLVIFNDYDQITSFAWVPFFCRLKKKHTFIVILHDPDRDHYLPFKFLSVYTMKKVMSIMDKALYHEVLPEKEYYTPKIPRLNVPHGIYISKGLDQALRTKITALKGEDVLMGMIGNIRDEKNYRLVIESLPQLPGVKLLIAGQQSGSAVPIQEYKSLIKQLNMEDRVIWVEKRLSEEELQAAICVCDVILLYYKKSFASQSGILNLIAPHKKNIIVSDTPSALRKTVALFEIGQIVPLGKDDFIASVKRITGGRYRSPEQNWDHYIQYASWENHVHTVLASLETDVLNPHQV